MPTVTIQGYKVKVEILSFDPGEQPYRKDHPDNWTPGEAAYIEFVFATENELFNELLTENEGYYNIAQDQLLARMRTKK